MERQSLSLDLDALFPGESLEIGGQSIIIRPLSIEQISLISKQLKGFGTILSKVGVTWENYEDKSSIFQIATVILETFPNILEEVVNVRVEDLKVLPMECIINMIDKALDVNLKSKDALEKNFKSLAGKFLPAKPQTIKKKVGAKRNKK